MSKLRYFFLSLNILNGLLAAAVAAVMVFVVIPLLNPGMISLPRAKAAAALSKETAAPPQSSLPTDYAVISDQNLFHPERRMPPEKQPEKVIPKPDLFLYGTLITNDTSFAFVEDKKTPYSTAGRGKRQLTLKKGDGLSGYILSEIEANRIVLVKGDDKLVVTLDDKWKKRTGETSASPATAQMAPGGTNPFQPAASSFPQAVPSSAQTGQSSGSEMGVPGTRPPTRRELVQEVQKIKAARQTSPQ
jgi:hypothetical protein